MTTRHNICPDENGRCMYGADEGCPELITGDTIKDASRYQYLREHWSEWSGKIWKQPIAFKLDQALDEAIEAEQKSVRSS